MEEKDFDQMIPARMIAHDTVTYSDYIIIDKGSRDGIAKDMAVLSAGVLVGQVSEAHDSTAKVVLITSKDSLVQAMLQESRAKGILRGGLSGLYIENIIQDVEYKKGEYVVTSGLGGKIREGILIGTAKNMRSSSSGIFKSIMVEPLFDFSKLEMVFVVK